MSFAKEDLTNTTISQDGTAIAFDRSGQGPAIVLVAGALSTRSSAGPLAALLAPHFTVFSYDRRGRGDSGDTPPYAVDREIQDLEAVIQQAGGSAFAYGHSSGAALALAAAMRGVAITRMALYEPPFMIDDTLPRPPKDYAAQLAGFIASGRRGDAVEYFMTQAVGVPAEQIAPMRAAPMWPALEAIAHTLLYDTAIMGDLTVPAQAVSVKVPTLVIDGGASPAWARNAVQAVARAIPGAQRRTLPGQTHGVDPQILAAVLIEFFDR
jgi:pimeloyl-ACP methyl ester carboxylesterase